MNNMNQSNRGSSGGGGDQSALSLLVNAADTTRSAGNDSNRGGPPPVESRFTAADALRLRGLTGGLGGGGGGGGLGGFGRGEPSLEEQLLLQQQGYGGGGSGLSNLIRDQNLLSQLGQQQQLASLLGLGGAGGSSQSPEMRQALAAASLRQSQAAPQFSQAELLALSRSGALSGLLGNDSGNGSKGYGGLGGGAGLGSGGLGAGSGLGGAGAGLGASGLGASDLESLQRLEELNRRSRLGSYGGGDPSSRSALERSAFASREQRPGLSDSPGRKGPEKVEQAQEASKLDMEKTPGSVIVPCRARGMPMDHNFKTAYFVIPENVKHGEELICSYFACRNAGIKFRYCSHCKVPVAKRNFRKRHKHGGEAIPRGDDSGGEEEVDKKGIPSQITASREEAADADGISSQSADDSVPDVKKKSFVDEQQGLVRRSMRSFESAQKGRDEVSSGNRVISAERNARWVALLAKRPSTKESDTMSAWLMDVLAVSDLDTPLKDEVVPMESIPEENPKEEEEEEEKEAMSKEDSDKDESEKMEEDEKEAVSDDDTKEDDEETEELDSSNGIVKKRPIDLREDTEKKEAKSGGFAEWKERKKQRKQQAMEEGIVPEESI